MILVGADPEVFGVQKGKLISAHGMIPGDKKNPHPVERGAVQVDGMAFEFNIDPAKGEEEFVFNLTTVMKQLREMVKGIDLLATPVADFGREMIDSQPPEAKELGCEPDFNAYTGRENPVPNVDAPFRTGSGHIHVGLWDPKGPQPTNAFTVARRVARSMDRHLAMPMALIDTDRRRSELYGKPGAFRLKPYGLEYRVLSNYWLRSEEMMSWVFRTTLKAVVEAKNISVPRPVAMENDLLTVGCERSIARFMDEHDIDMPKFKEVV